MCSLKENTMFDLKLKELIAKIECKFLFQKAARLYKTFKPREGLVKSRVKFTRCSYAMLHKQNFRPDPKSGWAYPSPTSSDLKAHTLGAKLVSVSQFRSK